MDNLTHTLFGVVLSRAGLNRMAPRATVTLLLAVNAPDIDIATSAWGSLAYLQYHRGLTHAVVALPVLAGLVAGVMRLLWGRKQEKFRWGRTYWIALLGVATHPLMDFTNTYGIRPWLPFLERWCSWDIMFVVDVWLWAALALSLIVPGLGRLISGEIGAPGGTGRGPAIAAVVFVVLWWGIHDLAHRRAMAMLDAHIYGPEGDGSPPERVAAFPTPTNPLVWKGLIETQAFYQVIPVHVLRPMDPTRGQIFYKPEPSPALDAALRTPTASAFARFARYRLDAVERTEDGYRVVFTDFRFSGERANAFVCTVELDRDLRVLRETFSF